MEINTVLGYMMDQPRALREAFKNREVYTQPFSNLFKEKKIKKVIFFGSGTSYNASHIASYYFKHLVGIDAVAAYPTVFKHYEKADWTNTLNNDEILFVGISQSGTSRSTISLMKHAKENGYQTLVLTENLESEITKHVDTVVHLLCGKELTPPETRGYTVTVLQLYLWALEAAKVTSVISESDYVKALTETKYLLDNFETVLEESEAWYDRNAPSIVSSDRIFVLGYGVDYGSALEGMLKIGEMLRLPTIGYEIEEYVHGPNMAITPQQTIFMMGSDEVEWKRSLEFRDIFKKYTPRVHLITNLEVENDDRDVVFSIKTNKYLAPLIHTIPFQFVSAKGALDTYIDTGINPFKDKLGHL